MNDGTTRCAGATAKTLLDRALRPEGLVVAVVGLALVLPLVMQNQYYLRVAISIIIHAMLALGLNLVLGYTGMFHFGQAAMFAIGAYTTALLTVRYHVGFPIAFASSMIFPVLASLLLGFPSLRVKGPYLALVTFAFNEIVRVVATSWVNFTGGPMGIPGVPPPNLFGLVIDSNTGFYYFGLVLLMLIYAGCSLVANSHFGRAFLAIREDDVAAASLGVNVGRYKVYAFLLSAIPAGIAGSFYASYLSFVGPTSFTGDVSILVAEMVMIGGMASLPGSILGASILVIALEVLRGIAQFRNAFIGLTLILTLVYRPQGLLGTFSAAAGSMLDAKSKRRSESKNAQDVDSHRGKASVHNSEDVAVLAPRALAENAPPVVVLRGAAVTKTFGGVKALQSLDFEVREGEILGLIGPNGSGKTTLFNTISGIFPPTSGQVFFDGELISGLTPHEIASRGLQRTFQNVRLFKRLTAGANVRIGGHLTVQSGLGSVMVRSSALKESETRASEDARKWLDFVGLSHRADEQARSLPYGEQKLLEMARALAANPKVLLLDEPAAGLNTSEVVSLAGVIRRIRDLGVTLFVVEHNMRLIMDVCDRIIVINFGQEVAEGTPVDIRRNPAVQDAYLGTT